MICIRCGTEVSAGVELCPNCGHRFTAGKRTFTATTTSFRALERRRQRLAEHEADTQYHAGDVVGGRYEVRDLVGVGPIGTVYRVHDREIETDLAMKVIEGVQLSGGSSVFLNTFKRVRKLSQQNIVRLYDADIDTDRCYFTMAFLEGLTLRKVMGLRLEKAQRFTIQEVEPIFNQVTMALGHAHRHTVHGGLKPENIIILPDVLKLTDFGGYEAVGLATFVAAQQEAGFGSYLAPELVAGGPLDRRVDIFSLGAMLHELLTGVPYAVDAMPPSKVLNMPGGAAAEGLDALVSRAVSPLPVDRFASVEAFSEALGTYIDERELGVGALRSVEAPLLPEDVTRKFMMPESLRDSGAPQAIAALVGAEASSDIEALSSLDIEAATSMDVRALGSADIESLRSVDLESLGSADLQMLASVDLHALGSADVVAVELPMVPPLQAGGVGSPPALTPPPMLTPPPTLTGLPTAPGHRHPAMNAPVTSGPWLLRSNIGFVLSIVVVVALVVFGALLLIERDQPKVSDGAPAVAALDVGVSKDAAPVEQIQARPTTVDVAIVAMPSDAGVVQDAARDAAKPPVDAKVAAKTPEPKPELAAVKTPKPKPAVKTPKPKPKPKPVVKTPKPKPEPVVKTPKPKPEPVVKTPEPKPEPVVKTPEPKPEPVVKTPDLKPEPVAKTPDPKPAAKDGVLSCPRGMVILKLARFPKRSVRRGKIKGAEAVAMALEGKAICVDAYEYPGRGSRPRTSVSFNAAKGLCRTKGKRLCTDREWRRACGGVFPYGKKFNAARCNTEDGEGDERAVTTSGKFKRCRGPSGTYDMSGNVAEWTSGQTVRGGDFASSDEDAACSAGGRRAAGSARASIGFRCCADFQR